ncbi:L-threonylcarbamoyladenylate synthase [Sphingomonas immobilis]|uniref:Threonylcarbamoyl-AMP synthase n=1 Tax=Sphingomonas immobilis TaxID=3063997 RepID=A0ABT9A3P9_9SPHN|nr:L-threonylcarbamoyladenylate synthase [Sphingomonas sp. CA1-15]MDO7843845.1 L-threonylcarbamoyladenylate synthase [Sphingomonas sp. CA1-15]
MNAPGTFHQTRLLHYGPDAIAEAAAMIKGGGVVAVASETVYGLAADATQPGAVAQVYAAKGRPAFNPLIVHVTDMAMALRLGEFDARAKALAESFWPGPLTLVVPRRAGAGIAALATAGLDTIAIRMPAHRAIRDLIAASGRPLAAPSANRSGAISPTRADHVLASLGGRIPLIVDDGPCECGVESTIVMEIDGATRVLRHGPIGVNALLATLLHAEGGAGGVDRFDPGLGSYVSRIDAPGQLASHYAPSKPLRINAIHAEHDEWMIGFGPIFGDATLSRTGNVIEAAARLFDLLHEADASPKAKIAVAPVPGDGVGTAINDRLRRAAHPGVD